MRRAAAAALGAALVVGLSACGIGPGKSTGRVSIVVTRDFGSVPVQGSPATVDAPGEETAMRALQRSFKVTTRYGGGFVQSIAGLGGGHSGGRPVDWFYYVNGIEAPKGAATVKLHRGDVVWWDRHDWGAAMRVPAVVGSFPEPFVHGQGGKRFPVRIECAPGADQACETVAKRLGFYGVVAGQAELGAQGGKDTLRVVVGTWSAIRRDYAAAQLERGPRASGVYARPAANGHSIAVLDPRGLTVRTLFGGTGLIAATSFEDLPPTWIVTGTDTAGLKLAASDLTPDALTGHFAVALHDDLPIPAPQVGPPK